MCGSLHAALDRAGAREPDEPRRRGGAPTVSPVDHRPMARLDGWRGREDGLTASRRTFRTLKRAGRKTG